MTSPPPFGASRSKLPLAENPLLALWRAFWLDLPLARAGEVDRFLYRWVQPVDMGDCLFGLDVGHGDGECGVEDGKRERPPGRSQERCRRPSAADRQAGPRGMPPDRSRAKRGGRWSEPIF
ncbi:hypothetical protein CTI14_03215 [Methylobacterium radiotolerans]|uniref:Uncharacterized protein n=2 Tax=Methylobacterium radiotolerans TaxID=31998 RepID=B1M144_METRJ|nr:hypothetical protein Mrad2831_2608 [Methylobacterium radiotolerans JCM 2831]PJI55632.1 hypothetical protein CTI14_03215 [Methylobacterium radiotolerans]